MNIVKYYTEEEFAKTVLNEPWKYLTFQISEHTEKELDKKCEFILKCQSINWQPLLLDYQENIRNYTKYFYVEK